MIIQIKHVRVTIASGKIKKTEFFFIILPKVSGWNAFIMEYCVAIGEKVRINQKNVAENRIKL